MFFFFKQKTAYEMRISDWSSDVCSSDLTNYQVSRNTASPKLVSVSRDFVRDLPIDWEPRGDQAVLSVEDWRVALSARLVPEARLPDEPMKFLPSFRELSYYYIRSEEQTSELKSLMSNSYDVFCLQITK